MKDEIISVKTKDELRKEFRVHLEYLYKQIIILKKAILALKETGINENLLAYIIQQSAKRFHIGTPINLKIVKYLIKGIESIDKYIFPKEE